MAWLVTRWSVGKRMSPPNWTKTCLANPTPRKTVIGLYMPYINVFDAQTVMFVDDVWVCVSTHGLVEPPLYWHAVPDLPDDLQPVFMPPGQPKKTQHYADDLTRNLTRNAETGGTENG